MAWNNKGVALLTMSNYDESIKAYDEATRFVKLCHHEQPRAFLWTEFTEILSRRLMRLSGLILYDAGFCITKTLLSVD